MKDLQEIFETIDDMKASQAAVSDIGTYAMSTGYDIPALQTAYKDYKKTGEVKTAGLSDSLLQGLTFNFSEEIGGALREVIPGGDDYDSYVDKQRSRYKLFQQKNPIVALGGEVLGSLPHLLIPGVGVVGSANKLQQTTKLAQVIKGSAVGALEGSISGVGAGEGLYGSIEGGIGGGVLGGLGGGALAGTGSIVQSAMQGLNRTPEQSAMARVLGSVDPSDPSIKEEFLKPTVSLADVGGDKAKAKLRALRTVDREASEFIDSTLSTEFKEQFVRIKDYLNDAFQMDKGLSSSILTQTENLKDLARLAYTDAYVKHSGINSASLNSFLSTNDKLGKYYEDVVPNLMIEYKNKNPELYSILSKLPKEASSLGSDSKVPLAVLDQMKKDMDSDLLGAIKDPSKFKASGKRAIQALQDELIDLTDVATGQDYGKLRSNFAEATEIEKAIELGRDTGRKDYSAADIRDMTKNFNAIESQAFISGVYHSLTDMIEKVGYSRDSVKTLLKSEFAESKLRALFPNDRSWGMFKRGLSTEAAKVRTKNYVMGGSNTADKQREAGAETGFLNDMLDIFTTDGSAVVSPRMLQKATSYLSERFSTVSQTRGLQSKILLETDPNEKRKIINEATQLKEQLARESTRGQYSSGMLGLLGGNISDEILNNED